MSSHQQWTRLGPEGRGTFSDLYEKTYEGLGRGSFGCVHTYRHRETGVEQAVKIINGCDNFQVKGKVFREIEIYNMTKHDDHILKLIDNFMEGKNSFFNIQC